MVSKQSLDQKMSIARSGVSEVGKEKARFDATPAALFVFAHLHLCMCCIRKR